MKKNITNTLMFITLLTSFIFINITINIKTNLNLSLGLITYSLTYLLSFILIKKYKLKECKQIILSSSIYFILFYLLITILCLFNSNIGLLTNIREIFTPNILKLSNLTIYYPNIIHIIAYLATFYITHYIYYITTDVLESYTNTYLSFIVSILISFLINQMLYETIINILPIINNTITINTYLNELTNNLFIVLSSSIILSPIILILNKIIKK